MIQTILNTYFKKRIDRIKPHAKHNSNSTSVMDSKKRTGRIKLYYNRYVYICICILGLSMSLTACSGIQGRQEEYSRSFFAMDTYMKFTVYDDSARNAQSVLEQAESQIKELEALWSVTDGDSDIYAVNHSEGRNVAVHEETAELLSFALEMAEETGGALEPALYPVLTAWGFTTGENQIPAADKIEKLLETVGYDRVILEGNSITLEDGMMLDLGAVGKGYAGDKAAQMLKDDGITSALLDIGGNIQAVGSKPDGSDWKLGLKNPFDEGILGVLEISDQAVVTSGNYERYFIGEDGVRYGHIVDPETGYPVDNGVASVTIISEEGKLCDALSTALFVMGKDKAAEYWKAHQNFDLIIVTENKEIYITDGIKGRFNLKNEYENAFVLRVLSSV